MSASQITPRSQAALDAVLDIELLAFERVMASVWLVLMVVGVFAGLVVAVTTTWWLGVVCSALCGVYLASFVPIWYGLRKGRPRHGLRVANDVLEATIPWTFMVGLVLTEGGAYALGSWVPPMLFSLLLLSHVVRMRERTPWILGVVGSATFLGLYLFVVRDRIAEAFTPHVLFQWKMQLIRSFTLAFAGVVAAVAVRYMRRVIGRADRHLRERELFGKYRLLSRIAVGGMAEVYEAVYAPEGGFERRVAVKRIHPHLAEQPRFVALFRTEAEIGSRLAHPSIVQVFDFGSREDSYFLAMEYVDGITLARLLAWCSRAGRALPEPVVGAVLRAILEGLHHAHAVARGPDGELLRVLHRDLCPQNVLLSRNGEVKISDFGVARALRDADASHTQTVVGHLGYMAPEQARAEPIDHRVDLFSAGVIGWELLVRRRLFKRSSQATTLDALLNLRVPPPSTLRPDLHPGWDAFLARALCRDPDGRPASAREMLAELDRVPTARADDDVRRLARLVREHEEAGADPSPDDVPTQLDEREARSGTG
ncbi:MAG TPA: serine/threonine-protein kinase [Sandaracinaceae bacterium LLY-WYZ-13_1]|nr:serine/threonine-protein kinase [Sandaracinaceae bacterium LLY-WYZ-13_1]